MRFDVVTIGSATVDHFADTDSGLIKIDTRTSHEALIAFPLGSKLLINELRVTTGGGGTNTAVAFARLGLLAKVDLLVVNREEACQLLNRDVAQGAHAYDRNHYYHGHPCQDIEILETTGAGDAFAATFTAAIIKGEPVAVALDYGMTNSESVLQNKGAKGGLLGWAEVTAIAEKHLRQIDITS